MRGIGFEDLLNLASVERQPMMSFCGRSDAAIPVRFLAAACVLLLAVPSCSSVNEPHSGVTLLVTNATCVAGRCDSLAVLAFPSNQPHTPGGFWSVDVGLITSRQACFTLPPSATFRVIGLHDDRTADTTTYTWTSADSLSLGAQPPSSSRLQASPSTHAFVPTTAPGWWITFPSGLEPTPTSPCTE
jgi:hypothetical protein